MFYFYMGVGNFKFIFSAISPLILKGLVPILQHLCRIFMDIKNDFKKVRWNSYLYVFFRFCHLKHFHISTLKQWSAFYLYAEADSLRQLHMCWGQARTGAAWRHGGDSHQPGHSQAPLSPQHREKVGKQKTRENLI